MNKELGQLKVGAELHRLDVDGATVLVLPDASLPVVRFAFATRHGAALDPQGRAGRTRAMLELLLRGTTSKPRAVFSEALERLGSQVQSSAGSELGLVRGIALKRHLDRTLALAGEALLAPAFAESELSTYVKETVEQLRAERDDDDSLAELFLRRALYKDHPLARSPFGEPRDVQELTRADISEAYRARLCQGELVVAFAGDLSVEEATRAARRIIEPFPQPTAPIEVLPPLPDPQGMQLWLVDKPERTQAQLRLAHLTVNGKHQHLYPLWLGTMAFGGTFTSPFCREVRDVRGWSYTAHAELPRRRARRAPLVLRSAPALTDLLDCLALELDLWAKLAAGDLANDDIELARSYVLNRYPFEVATPADLLLPAVQNELLGLAPEALFATPREIESLPADAVRSALATHLSGQQLVAVMVATAKEILPALRERFAQAHLTVVDFQDGL